MVAAVLNFNLKHPINHTTTVCIDLSKVESQHQKNEKNRAAKMLSFHSDMKGLAEGVLHSQVEQELSCRR
jgi:hypothetical protein